MKREAIFKIFRSFLFLALMLLPFISCVKSDNSNDVDPNAPKRTLLMYLIGDESLISRSLDSIPEEILKGWKYTGNTCLIYVDVLNKPPMLLRVRGACALCPAPYIDTIEVYDESDSASKEVFKKVIDKVITDYPADSYGLIVTSHASGWLPAGTLARPSRTVGADKETGDGGRMGEMELSDMASAIQDLDNGKQFAYIIFEGCFMAGIEVAYEFRNKADYILASSGEIIVPGYNDILKNSHKHLFNNDNTLAGLKAFATDYMTHVNTLHGAYKTATLSIINTSEVDRLVYLTSYYKKDVMQDIEGMQYFDRYSKYNARAPRFFDYLQAMEHVTSVSVYAAITEQINKVVVWEDHTEMIFQDIYEQNLHEIEVKQHSGLTIYVPQVIYPNLNASYYLTDWYKAISRARVK